MKKTCSNCKEKFDHTKIPKLQTKKLCVSCLSVEIDCFLADLDEAFPLNFFSRGGITASDKEKLLMMLKESDTDKLKILGIK